MRHKGKRPQQKDFAVFAAINNNQDYSEGFQARRRAANDILIKYKAVDATLEELAKAGVGSADLAEVLVSIGDPKAVPLLKTMLDRGNFRFAGSAEGRIRAFVEEYPQMAAEIETVTCALCGTPRPVTETEGYSSGALMQRFCTNTCWEKRGLVLGSKVGVGCPFYAEGMCGAGHGIDLCVAKGDSYATCNIYTMEMYITRQAEAAKLHCVECKKVLSDWHYGFESIIWTGFLGYQCPDCGQVWCIEHTPATIQNIGDKCSCGGAVMSLEKGPAYTSMIEGARRDGKYSGHIHPPDGRAVKEG